MSSTRSAAAGFMLLAWCVFAAAPRASAENWPAWRGPEGTGISGDKSPPVKWTEKENVRWRVALPDRGNSTPVVCGDRVFVTQAVEKEHRRTVMCFARADGKLLWQAGVVYNEREPTNAQNPYCAGSPVTDGTRVIAYFGSAGVYCYDLAGKELWHRDVGKSDSWHGSGSSPVLFGDLCIVNAGPGTNAALVALAAKTGEPAWKVDVPKIAPGAMVGLARFASGLRGGAKNDPAPQGADADKAKFDAAALAVDMAGAGGYLGSWSTPLLVKVGGRDELIVSHATKLAGYDPKTGRELWTCDGLPEQVFASPTAGEGVLVATAKFQSGGTQVLAVRLDDKAAGNITATHRLWQTRLPKECVGSPVITAGHAYLVTQFGSIVCLDLKDGNKLAEKRLTGQGALSGSWSSPVLADGKLFIPNQSGEVFIVKPSPELDILATNSAGDEATCASPAISDGQIFLRTYKALWCIGGKG